MPTRKVKPVKPGIPFFKPHFPEAKRQRISKAVSGILGSGQLMMGPWKDRFEAGFTELCGTSHAISVNSATTALQIGLQFFGVSGREVLVPAGSFVTDISAILFAGGTPVLVDMNPETLSFDLDDLGAKLSPRTAGLVWVHLTGIISPEYQAIIDFAQAHGLFLIEDASHAHGAAIDGRMAGSLGDMGVFSFYPTKVVTSGTGGMITTENTNLKAYAEQMRMFGKDAASGDIVALGNDWFLDEIRCCVGWHGLEDLDAQLARRRRIASRYTDRFRNQPGLSLLDPGDGQQPAWYHYTVLVDVTIDRAALGRRLKDLHGISSKSIYKPTHREPVFRHLDDGSLGVTEMTLDRSLCLPMYVDLEDSDVDIVADAVIGEIAAARQT